MSGDVESSSSGDVLPLESEVKPVRLHLRWSRAAVPLIQALESSCPRVLPRAA